MLMQMFKKTKNLDLERSYRAAIETVWRAWTEPDMLRQWWGPEKTFVPECEIDLVVGGKVYVVMEAGEAMGKYQGTRWPMAGTFTRIEEPSRLSYDARSWTEGEEDGSTIHHTNDVTLTERDGMTVVHLHVTITNIGPKAKMAAFGMKWGYKAQLDKLEKLLSTR
ncbi:MULTISPECIES: SRPBCC domain-containing protein [unclassified Mycobacterium]|uniref:SRPBCC family protein n=1 Tax=unclassified Mycobacterium TaxID=2642494 RepID=UPI0007403B4F|nr:MULTISPECIES: SRPBCC domain-containing protein [unclassified Mycobacterium]KUH86237.1 ATPase [Mycobacterium sp. IS-1556]KUH86822.1 ATPase [Mycobacterium sp. GA-0227b]KUH92098.1 ATPase [Mycobacterium sp. GA-1999]